MQRAIFTPFRRTLVAGQAARSMRLVSVRTNSTKAEEVKETGETKESSEKSEESVEEPVSDEISQIQAKLNQKDKDLADMKNRFARAIADFRNLQESTKQEVQKAKDFALQKFAKDLLESVDNFDLALGSIKNETNEKNKELNTLIEGVTMTKNIFEKTLNKHGIAKIDPVGQPFNPNEHEAIFELAQPDKEAGTVFHVQQAGYTLNSRVLRPAKVGVVKGEE